MLSVDFQENRLKQYRIEQPHNTALLSAELTSVRNLLESKQRELTQSMLKVDKITQALSDLQKTQGRSWNCFCFYIYGCCLKPEGFSTFSYFHE